MFTRNLRLVIAVMCVPMPPVFLALPERQIMLPFIGRLPVNSQMRAIKFLLLRAAKNTSEFLGDKFFFRKFCVPLPRAKRIFTAQFYGHTKTFCRPATQTRTRRPNLRTA